MKIKLIIMVTILFVTFSNAQAVLVVYPSKPDNPKHGISKNLTYSTIISTTKPKKEVIKEVITFLTKNEFLDPSKNKIKEINENLSEVNFNLGYLFSYFNGAGMMGQKYMRAPIKLNFKCNLKFNAEGQIAMTFTEFEEESFYLITNQVYDQEGKTYTDEQKALKEELMTLYIDEINSTTALLKVFSVLAAIKEPEMMKKYLEDALERKHKAEQLFNKAIKADMAQFVPDNQLGDYIDTKIYPKYVESTKNAIKERIDNGFLLSLDNDRWNKRIEPLFNDIFLMLTQSISGKIEGIALDGVVKYEMKGDELKKKK